MPSFHYNMSFFLAAVKTGELKWATLTALSYFYMVSAWGGYVFIINLIPLHAFVLILMGRFSQRLYVAYSVFFILGSYTLNLLMSFYSCPLSPYGRSYALSFRYALTLFSLSPKKELSFPSHSSLTPWASSSSYLFLHSFRPILRLRLYGSG